MDANDCKEEEMLEEEMASSHFATSSFFSPPNSEVRSRSLAPEPEELKEEEIEEDTEIEGEKENEKRSDSIVQKQKMVVSSSSTSQPSLFALQPSQSATSAAAEQLQQQQQQSTAPAATASLAHSQMDVSTTTSSFDRREATPPPPSSSSSSKAWCTVAESRSEATPPLSSSSSFPSSLGPDFDQHGHKIKRPLNAFMVWAKMRRAEIIASSSSKLRNAEISKELGVEWRAMSGAAKQPYMQKAEELRNELFCEHPHYVYRPRSTKARLDLQCKTAKKSKFAALQLPQPATTAAAEQLEQQSAAPAAASIAPSHMTSPSSLGPDFDQHGRKIRRPMNAFMVYAQTRRAEVAASSSGKVYQTTLSKELGVEWRNLSPAAKRPYLEKAEELQEELLRAHPHYAYRPRPRKTRPVPQPPTTDAEQLQQQAAADAETVAVMQDPTGSTTSLLLATPPTSSLQPQPAATAAAAAMMDPQLLANLQAMNPLLAQMLTQFVSSLSQ